MAASSTPFYTRQGGRGPASGSAYARKVAEGMGGAAALAAAGRRVPDHADNARACRGPRAAGTRPISTEPGAAGEH